MARLLKERQVWTEEEVDVPEGPRQVLIAGPFANYPEGAIVDTICVTHGRALAGHGEDEECFW
jgi:hypothetical protein